MIIMMKFVKNKQKKLKKYKMTILKECFKFNKIMLIKKKYQKLKKYKIIISKKKIPDKSKKLKIYYIIKKQKKYKTI